jgi:hypothetical protein
VQDFSQLRKEGFQLAAICSDRFGAHFTNAVVRSMLLAVEKIGEFVNQFLKLRGLFFFDNLCAQRVQPLSSGAG